MNAPPTILALVTDLIFATKITSTATSLGVDVKVVRTLSKLHEALTAGGNALVLIDLNADGVKAIEAIEVCRCASPRSRTIAYASHVQADLITAARQAGADEVLARSAFAAKLPMLLAAARDQTAGPVKPV